MMGVYALKLNGQYYVGSSTNIERRVAKHLTELKANKHVNPKLQQAYKLYGEPEILILQESKVAETEYLRDREQHYMDKYNSVRRGYNTINANGGPLRERTYEENQIIKAFLLIGTKPETDICLETGITPKMLKGIRLGTFAEWLVTEYPTEYNVMRVTAKSTGYNKFISRNDNYD